MQRKKGEGGGGGTSDWTDLRGRGEWRQRHRAPQGPEKEGKGDKHAEKEKFHKEGAAPSL